MSRQARPPLVIRALVLLVLAACASSKPSAPPRALTPAEESVVVLEHDSETSALLRARGQMLRVAAVSGAHGARILAAAAGGNVVELYTTWSGTETERWGATAHRRERETTSTTSATTAIVYHVPVAVLARLGK